MTYVSTSCVGAAPRARFRRARRSRNAIAALRRRPFGESRYVMNRERREIPGYYALGDYDGLGRFSLRRAFTPPRKVRQFIAKHKTALLVGAGVLTAGLFAPAAALAIGKGALSAGRFVGREIAAGERGLVRLGKKLIPQGDMRTPGTIPDQSDTGPSSAPSPPAAPSMPDLTLPSQTGGGAGGSSAAYPQDYGGGAPSEGDTPTSDQPIDTSTPKQAGMNPVVVIGGLALLGLAFAGGNARGARKR